MLFERGFHAGLVEGSITLSFRRWSTARVKAGSHYRCPPIGILMVEAVDRVAPQAISDAEARRAGFQGREALLRYLDRGGRSPLHTADKLVRVAFRFAGPLPDRGAGDAELSAKERAAIAARLARLDRASRRGPWTARTLALIARHPGRAAAELAAAVGVEKPVLKRRVRNLNALGLTLSLPVGYELSRRGRAVVAADTSH